ncbi:Hypothetical predicted protein [Paramuricea clavata]|uniref:Uncharacterized protein n=1 Tax=Paramuricea clavata TaxID=317549 RepID=A0A6S7HGG1_PARCT|nr:Hypothetical predicted protein [Paramuricea clavata]
MRTRKKLTADEESCFKKAVADLPRDENLSVTSIMAALNNGSFYMSCQSATEFTKQQIRDKTRGDGNRLYRTCSKLLCGIEDLCGLLRDLTSIELFNNQEFYAFHPYVKEKSHVFQADNTAFSATASDSALGDGYNRKDPSSRVTVVKREAIRNTTGGTYASLMCVFDLSTGMGVISFQNGTIWPRLFHNNIKTKLVQEAKLILMWITHGIHILPGMSKDFQPNHFVPLVEFITKSAEKKKLPQQLPI